MISVFHLGTMTCDRCNVQQRLVELRKEAGWRCSTPLETLGDYARAECEDSEYCGFAGAAGPARCEVFECGPGGDVIFMGRVSFGYPIFDLSGISAHDGKRKTLA